MRAPLWLRVVLATAMLPGTFAVLVPSLIGASAGRAWSTDRLLLAAGGALAILGAGIYVACAREFAVRGGGTPAPWDAPGRLVVRGIYARSRNPMYVGVLALVLGQGVMRESPEIALYVLCLAGVFHARILAYEEPRNAREFPLDFAAYCRRVPRWLAFSGARGGKGRGATSGGGRGGGRRPR